ncbi:hypothetical protein IE81DRAFT_320325 [Ceraceosorus guamensis]|uniref:SAC domain-containing protein n=1 Tax=Ceraceosorus guamensis TaxID=1522189 RepID=A0A316W5X4_9BASI|nr:hypothetical protein IE81DRAFT_320325 [Ceraceosorus guamensis]PWN45152.1 hypothetical protein IE81DRAFT_320325 [Ceraceosorus guamensis]
MTEVEAVSAHGGKAQVGNVQYSGTERDASTGRDATRSASQPDLPGGMQGPMSHPDLKVEQVKAISERAPTMVSAPASPTEPASTPKLRESELPSDTGAAYALIGLGIPTSARPNESPPAVKRAATSPAVPQSRAEQNKKLSAGLAAQSQHETGRMGELKRFTLWETRTRFYLVAFNTSQTRFRILKIDRTAPSSKSSERSAASGDPASASKEGGSGLPSSSSQPQVQQDQSQNPGLSAPPPDQRWELNITSDRVVYSRQQVTELLDMINEGNRSSGGLKEVGRFYGIVGFIRFTMGYHMVLISARSVVALIGGHYVYHVDDYKMISVCHASVLANLPGRSKAKEAEEARLIHTFKQVDLTKNFYFSYTYDLTKTLQDNLTGIRDVKAELGERGLPLTTAWGHNEKFVWNHHLLLPAFGRSIHLPSRSAGPSAQIPRAEEDADAAAAEWVLPLVYGFVEQAKLGVINRTIHITLLARRSRHFAGARFLKRGTDEHGHVANDVETEQIVAEGLSTPFYAPKASDANHSKGTWGANPRFTSYVMHRGSIPIYWTQDSTNMSPRPPIEISVVDPYFSSAALHFDDMLRRYGYPLIVLNLIKSKEKQPREMKLLQAFSECVSYLNQFLPDDKQIKYIAWDMSRASKSQDQDVIGVLEDIAEDTVESTRFFHSGPEPYAFEVGAGRGLDSAGPRRESLLLQHGVARVNCVDCLDRTNAAQFVIGKAALGHQLHALGLLDHPSLPFDSDAVDMLTEMYHDLGDTIALQYGGSHLVNTMETYRKLNQWTSHSRDMLEGLKRYYANSFADADKQAAINLFLGVEPEHEETSRVAKAASSTPQLLSRRTPRRSYQQWYTPQNLRPRASLAQYERRLAEVATSDLGFWAEYYRPSLFTDLLRHYAFKMTAVNQSLVSGPNIPSTAAYVQASRFAQGASGHGRKSSTNSTSNRSVSLGSLADTQSALRSAIPLMENDSSFTLISPFTARIGSGTTVPASPARTDRASQLSTSGIAADSQPRALMGGVRRWMSLNRGDHASSSTSQKASRMKGRRSGARGAGGTVWEHASTSEFKEALTISEKDAWPIWGDPQSQAVLGATPSATALRTLVSALIAPEVPADEANEYANWLEQYRELCDLAASPSTRIADEDAEIYVAQAQLANGDTEAVARFSSIRTCSEAANGHAPNALGYHASDEELLQSVEPALAAYATTASMLKSGAPSLPASENKLRAYKRWLAGF